MLAAAHPMRVAAVRRFLVALANTLALVFAGTALAAALGASWLVWGMAGLLWAAVPCGVIAAGCALWLGALAEGEDAREVAAQRDKGSSRRRA